MADAVIVINDPGYSGEPFPAHLLPDRVAALDRLNVMLTFTDRSVFVNGDPMMNIQWSDAGDYTDWDRALENSIMIEEAVGEHFLAITREIARET